MPFLLAFQAFHAGVKPLVFWEWVERACSDSGFLPYRTVPFVEFYLECDEDFDVFSSCVSEYYESKEGGILQSIESYLESLDCVDEDRRETLQEAFKAHRSSQFRLTVPALLPLIERVILEDWMGKKKGEVHQLSKRMIHEAVDNFRLADFRPNSIYDLTLLRCLIGVLYENGGKLKESHRNLLPNRHAALHGWRSYSRKEESLNTFILVDYLYRLVPLFRARKD